MMFALKTGMQIWNVKNFIFETDYKTRACLLQFNKRKKIRNCKFYFKNMANIL